MERSHHLLLHHHRHRHHHHLLLLLRRRHHTIRLPLPLLLLRIQPPPLMTSHPTSQIQRAKHQQYILQRRHGHQQEQEDHQLQAIRTWFATSPDSTARNPPRHSHSLTITHKGTCKCNAPLSRKSHRRGSEPRERFGERKSHTSFPTPNNRTNSICDGPVIKPMAHTGNDVGRVTEC